MTWEPSIHVPCSVTPGSTCSNGLLQRRSCCNQAYKLPEQCPRQEEGPLLALTRAWTLVDFLKAECSNCRAATAVTVIL
ncbi:FlhC family transcriptional regulator [Shigella flexneri]